MNYIKKSFLGRINRLQYITGNIALTVLFYILYFALPWASSQIGIVLQDSHLTIALSIAMLYFGSSLVVRRLHDIGKGWVYALLIFIPYINLLFGLYLAIMQGEEKDNKYGNIPKGSATMKTIFYP